MAPVESDILTILERAAEKHGSRFFLAQESEEGVAYAQFLDLVRSGWTCLQSERVARGEAVAIISDNSPFMVAAICSLITYGAVAMPINPKLKPSEIDELIAHSGARLVITPLPAAGLVPDGARIIAPADFQKRSWDGTRPRVSTGEGCLLIYTSGTTGMPKGVLLNQQNIINNVTEVIRYFSIDSDHRKACI